MCSDFRVPTQLDNLEKSEIWSRGKNKIHQKICSRRQFLFEHYIILRASPCFHGCISFIVFIFGNEWICSHQTEAFLFWETCCLFRQPELCVLRLLENDHSPRCICWVGTFISVSLSYVLALSCNFDLSKSTREKSQE